MRLREYDDRCVQVTDRNGEVFEGVCAYNGRDYNEHEFGRREDGLQISYLLLFRSDIREIRSLEEHSGPYGRFTRRYGRLEEMAAEAGPDIIEEVLFSGKEAHILRLLACLGDRLKPDAGCALPCRGEVLGQLALLDASDETEAVRAGASRLLAEQEDRK